MCVLGGQEGTGGEAHTCPKTQTDGMGTGGAREGRREERMRGKDEKNREMDTGKEWKKDRRRDRTAGRK